MKSAIRVVVLLPLACGCAQKPPAEIAPFSGTITQDDQPLAAAQVLFMPLERNETGYLGPSAYAETDEHGRFKLVVDPDREGARVGRNLVWISKTDDSGNTELVPARYNRKTQLVVEVPAEGKDDANLRLTASAEENPE